VRRIVHARGDSTGHEIQRVLFPGAVLANVARIPFASRRSVVETASAGERRPRRGGNHLLPRGPPAFSHRRTGLYLRTTNPPVATETCRRGYGRARDAHGQELVQFHPTALYYTNAPQFLL
jgi:aspartate oxidase